MEKFSVQLPLTGEYLTTVRLTTGGLCSLMGFDIDSAEDFKVCVTESLLIFLISRHQLANTLAGHTTTKCVAPVFFKETIVAIA